MLVKSRAIFLEADMSVTLHPVEKSGRNSEAFQKMFYGFKDSVIFTVLEGISGELFADDEKAPQAALISAGDFRYLAGTPAEITDIKGIINPASAETTLITDDDGWLKYLENSLTLTPFRRYRTHAPARFDEKKLRRLSEVPDGFSVRLMTKDDFDFFESCGWGRDLRGQCRNWGEFSAHAAGAVVAKDGLPVSGTSAYAYYSKGIEIQIETRKEYRRRGLGTASAAVFLLECQRRGLTPHWDAAHLGSLRLSEKLGFISDGEYAAYNVRYKLEDK